MTSVRAQPPEWMHAAALAALPMQTHRRLRQLIDAGPASVVWEQLATGGHPVRGMASDVMSAWHAHARRGVGRVGEACVANGIVVVSRHDASYPMVLRGDPAAPAVLFVRGDLGHLERRRVGIVGTRHPTGHGARLAMSLGAELAVNSVAVVSGLARGIDVHSHLGMFQVAERAAQPIAVVASGLDRVYPPEHRTIWEKVATEGVLLSEFPPGTAPTAHRFPLRNRIIAAISEVLVVVESGHRGGSMITVREAMKRGTSVMAVPGAPHLRQSEGTTALLRDGCAPVGDVDDILVALGLDNSRTRAWRDSREAPDAIQRVILDAMGREPRSIDEIVLATSMPVLDVAVLLGALREKNWVCETDGWWEALID